MRVKIIGTGSSGNCYLIVDDMENVLVLDCGMKTDLVKNALDYNIKKISGCFVSHSHG